MLHFCIDLSQMYYLSCFRQCWIHLSWFKPGCIYFSWFKSDCSYLWWFKNLHLEVNIVVIEIGNSKERQ